MYILHYTYSHVISVNGGCSIQVGSGCIISLLGMCHYRVHYRVSTTLSIWNQISINQIKFISLVYYSSNKLWSVKIVLKLTQAIPLGLLYIMWLHFSCAILFGSQASLAFDHPTPPPKKMNVAVENPNKWLNR